MNLKYFIKRNGRSLALLVVSCAVLVTVMMTVTYYLRLRYLDIAGTCQGSNSLIHFCPKINDDGFFFGTAFGVPYNREIFLGIAIVGAFALAIYYLYLLYLSDCYGLPRIMAIPSVLMLAGCLGRGLERLFWEYTFDFIAVQGIPVFDILDLYLWLGGVGLVITSVIFYIHQRKATRSMDKLERKRYLSEQTRGFFRLFSSEKNHG